MNSPFIDKEILFHRGSNQRLFPQYELKATHLYPLNGIGKIRHNLSRNVTVKSLVDSNTLADREKREMQHHFEINNKVLNNN